MDARRGLGLVALLAGIALIALGGVQLVGALSGQPTLTPEPTAEPSSGVTTPPPSPTITPAPSPTPTAAPTPAPTPTPTPDPVAASKALYALLIPAIRSADAATLLALLHPETLARYGEAACRTYFEGLDDPEFDVEVTAVQPPAAWDYTTDGITTSIPDAWTVEAQFTSGGQTNARELHIAAVDGELRWFTDCGTPLSP